VYQCRNILCLFLYRCIFIYIVSLYEIVKKQGLDMVQTLCEYDQ